MYAKTENMRLSTSKEWKIDKKEIYRLSMSIPEKRLGFNPRKQSNMLQYMYVAVRKQFSPITVVDTCSE